MVDVFISHSSKDKPLADAIYRALLAAGLSAFLAPISIRPGCEWDGEIRRNLKTSRVVIFLMSKAACASLPVGQELAMAAITGKKIIPLVWDIAPEELPDALRKYQALDLRNLLVPEAEEKIAEFAKTIKSDLSGKDALTALLVAGFLVLLVMKSK